MDTPLIVHKIPELEGISIGLKYFDDDTNLYVSPSVFSKISKGDFQLRFVTMFWRKSQKSIEEIATRLIDDVIQYGKETGQLT